MFLFDLLVGEFLVTELQDVLDDAGIRHQLVPERNDLPNNDGGTRERLQNRHLSPLDAFCDLDFTVAREQWHGSHLAQIHAHGIVGLFQSPRRQVQFDIFGLFFEFLFASHFVESGKTLVVGIDHFDTGRPKGRK